MKKLLKISSVLAIAAGAVLVTISVWAIDFTYDTVARENIVTPADASIPNVPVRGPLTLKAQADIIRHHTLAMTGGKTYAEMSRDDKSRDIWVTATTLTTALNLGIFAYIFSAAVFLFGLVSMWTGMVFWKLAKR